MTYRQIICILTIGFIVLFGCIRGQSEKSEEAIWLDALNRTFDKKDSLNNIKALEALENLVNTDSTNSDYAFKEGVIYARLHFYDQSTKTFLRAIKVGYSQTDCYKNVAINYIQSNQEEQSIPYLIKLKRMSPDDADVNELIKFVQLKLGKPIIG